jgi:hypothetical protein
MSATSVEPTIAEILSDPIVGLLMEHDGVTVEEIRRLIKEARGRLIGDRAYRSQVTGQPTR